MKTSVSLTHRLTTAVCGALLAAGGAIAAPGILSDSPLFLSDSVEPNIILGLDNSGSMDGEVLMPTNDGGMWWSESDDSFVGRDANDNLVPGTINYNRTGGTGGGLGWRKYVYLFPNGTGSDARRTYGNGANHFAVPPTLEHGFIRSSDYNAGYYDPSIDYGPWVDTGTRTFNDINPTAAPWDPIQDPTTFTVDLTSDITGAANDDWRFWVREGMRNNLGAVSTVSQAQTFDYFPATYFVRDDTATLSLAGAPINCLAPNAINYVLFRATPPLLVTGTADAVGPDGACLVRYEIRPTTPAYPSGRSYADEMQNFANWFSYYRKRHQALRGGLTQALDEISGVRVGSVRFNGRSPVNMLSLTTDKDAVLENIFTTRGNGGTPTRETLDYIGDQFERTGAGRPVTNACQKNYAIIFTDGFANNSSTGVGNADGTSGAPYQDAWSNTLGDIAMDRYENLNVPGYGTGQVPVPIACSATPDPWIDCNRDLHMNTFAVTLNATGTIFGVTHFTREDAHNVPPAWPQPNLTRNPRMVDDLYHAAVNGRGEMLNARTPEEIARRMADVLATVIETEGTAAAVTFNTGLLSSDSLVYQAKLDSEQWSGFVTASALDPVTGAVASTPDWDAADLIPTEGARQISTWDPAVGGVPFRDVSDLTVDQLADLSIGLPVGLTVQDMLDYLRGDRAFENDTQFRERASRTVLGDIVHSGPVLVGNPGSNWPSVAPFPTGSDAYSDFRDNTTRREAVYVGANDGILHGFWADTGQADSGVEFMGYVPNSVFSATPGEGLHALADQNYDHRYYVDLTPAVTDAFIKTTTAGTPDWRTVLVGGLRGGGAGYFALDITDPTLMSEANADDYVLWEFSDSDDSDLGTAFAEPTISLMNNGRWAAVFGNGYNSASGGDAHLFIVFLDGGLDRTWTLGSDYIKIDVPGAGNGLGTPQLADLDSDGTPDRVYAGDLLGNMWAFDVSSSSAASWDSDYTSAGVPVPLFTADNNAGDLQPITSKPILARCPYDNSVSPDIMVLFGTGQYLTEGDKTSTEEQTFYGIWDRGIDELDRGDLLEQLAMDPSVNVASPDVRVPTQNTFDPLSDRGWYMDLPATGERVVSNPLVRGDIVFFNTIIPDSGDPCIIGGGGFLMSVNICDGGRPDAPVFDLDRDNAIDNGDTVADTVLTDGSGNPIVYAPGGERFNPLEGLPWQSSVLGDRQYTPGSTGNIETRAIEVENTSISGRLSWEQVINE